MKRYVLGLLLILLVVAGVQAQTTTVVNFDTPSCSGNVVSTYQGIDFSLSPWDCERPTLTGDATETISWYKQIATAKFMFVNPSVLISFRIGSSALNGTFSITTDAGEAFSGNISGGRMGGPFVTNFSKPASVVTVETTVGWTIEFDDITYKTGPVIPASITISPKTVALPVMPSQIFANVISNSTSTVVTWSATCGSITQEGVYTPPATIPPGGTCTITVTLRSDPTKTASAVVTIGSRVLAITTTALPGGSVGLAYSASLTADGGKVPYTWSMVSGVLPAGLVLNTAGVISGTPTEIGTASFIVQVVDSSGVLARKKIN